MKKIFLLILVVAVFAGCSFTTRLSQPGETATDTPSEIIENVPPEDQYLASLPEEYQRLTIPYLRKQDFPGSTIETIQTLAPGLNYEQSVVKYESEGLSLQGLLTKPEGPVPEGGFPAVVFIHGYVPPQQYVTTERYVAYVDYLARNGLVVFKIDLRGHGNSEGAPNGAYYSADYIYDVLNAYASLQRLDYVNSEQIGLWGHSMAGNIVLRSMATKPTIPVGVIWAGAVYTYVDMREYGISDSSYQPDQNPNRGRREELYKTVGEVSAENQFWQMVAPANYVDDLTGTIHMHHAANDPVVPIDYSRNLETILSQAQADYQLYEYTDGGHDLESPAFGVAMQRTAAILKGQ